MTESNTNNYSRIRADLMLLLAVLAWALTFSVAKIALSGWENHKFLLLTGRFWMAFFIFLSVAVYMRISLQEMIFHLKPGIVLGILFTAIAGFQFAALKHGSSVEVAFFTALSSVFVPLVGFHSNKRVSVKNWIGLIVATAGAILMALSDSLSITLAGALALVASIGLAFDTNLVSKYLEADEKTGQKYGKMPLLVVQFFVMAIATTILSASFEIPTFGFPSWDAKALFGMIFMAVFATVGAFYIQYKYQPKEGPESSASHAAVVYLMEAPIAALAGFLILSESFTPKMFVGALLIILGIIIVDVFDRYKITDRSKSTIT